LLLPGGAVRVQISEFAAGAQGSSAPVETEYAASRDRAAPPAVVKPPPRYTVVGETASARARPLRPALKPLRTAPVAASSATKRLRTTPLTEVKSPATKIVRPSADAAMAMPCAFSDGAQEVSSWPVLRV
jgi:hypothetical protein